MSLRNLLLALLAVALACSLTAEVKPIAQSGKMTSSAAARTHSFDVPLESPRKLYLVVDDAGDGYSCDWANWIDPKVAMKDGTTLSLVDLKPERAIVGWGRVRQNRNAGGAPLSIAGTAYPGGLGVHAHALLEYDLPEGATRFSALVGIDDGGAIRAGAPSAATMRFSVYVEAPPREGRAAGGGGSTFDPDAVEPRALALDQFTTHEDLEVTLWAQSPLFFNPTNMDVDHAGRIWVAEGVNYRTHRNRRPEGDRIVVLEDTDQDGKADRSHVFVQSKELIAPLGVAVVDNRIIVSQPPDMIVYTDVDRDLRYDPAVDFREVLLTGFGGWNHDHSLHSVTVGPDGKWYWNQGNTGAEFTDQSDQTFRIGSPYKMQAIAGQASDDGHVYVGGFSARMNPDGTKVEIIGHNYRNSYEHVISSLGDLFQNDNDDPPACRTSYVMEYGNFGFASSDGKRAWGLDKKPGETTQVAEWRQNDPGVVPAGDVYGTGSPTGIALYENGALGAGMEGLLLSCEAARNVVFGYHPQNEGAGFQLERFEFFTSNQGADADSGRIKGTDSTGGTGNMDREGPTLFRPSDVMVGADGAIYVADWFDPRVGGHADVDDSCSGAIYRIAPKDFVPRNPEFDLDTLAGQIASLESPAINVRALGFYRLRERGESAVPAVRALLDDPNRFIQGRAIHLLAQLGEKGALLVESLLDSDNPDHRMVAYRALRRADGDWLLHAGKLADDPEPRIRREVALSLRDVAPEKAVPVLMALASYDHSQDRSALEAWGIGATGKEKQIYSALREEGLFPGNGLEWDANDASLAWRLMTPGAVTPLLNRAMAAEAISEAAQVQAVDGLAFIDVPSAADALIEIALQGSKVPRARAEWWLRNRLESRWKSDELNDKLVRAGLISGEPVPLASITVPPPVSPSKLPSISRIAAIEGRAAEGKAVAARCVTCHHFDGQGTGFGPGLDGWASAQAFDVIAKAIIEPSADIAHGYEGTRIETKAGVVIEGRVLAAGDPVRIQSMGGLVQAVAEDEIRSSETMGEKSLMMSADQLGMTAQDVADVIAYLKTL